MTEAHGMPEVSAQQQANRYVAQLYFMLAVSMTASSCGVILGGLLELGLLGVLPVAGLTAFLWIYVVAGEGRNGRNLYMLFVVTFLTGLLASIVANAPEISYKLRDMFSASISAVIAFNIAVGLAMSAYMRILGSDRPNTTAAFTVACTAVACAAPLLYMAGVVPSGEILLKAGLCCMAGSFWMLDTTSEILPDRLPEQGAPTLSFMYLGAVVAPLIITYVLIGGRFSRL